MVALPPSAADSTSVTVPAPKRSATPGAVPKPQGGAGTSLEDQLTRVLDQMQVLTAQNASLIAELGELRRENAWLRRRLDEGPRFVHQPYGPVCPVPLLPGCQAAPGEGVGLTTPLRPSSPVVRGGEVQDMGTDSPAKLVDPEAKRPRQGGSSPHDA